MAAPELCWLPAVPDWNARLADTLARGPSWGSLCAIANARLDFISTARLDRAIARLRVAPAGAPSEPCRCALLGSSTVDHLLPGIRIAALRRGLNLAAYTNGFGQYRQELFDPSSALHAFKPQFVVFALDARHVLAMAAGRADVVESIARELAECWRKARVTWGCDVLQQTVLPLFPPAVGNNEHRSPQSSNALVERINARLRTLADEENVDLVSIEQHVTADGLSAWYDPSLWYRAKQEIHPAASPMYGDLVARSIAALRGRSYKCLVLDLDNTLWGGVIGESGIEGIVLGQGNPLGESFLEFQQYVRELSHRGVILAVASKNEERHALAAFDSHSEMILRRSDIACFAVNWGDKAENLRSIAERLGIGLDSMVFADDNPIERERVRTALPMVAVPELSDDPARFVRCIAAAGYFEAVRITRDDSLRARQYQENIQREVLRETATDLDSFLSDLRMEMCWQPLNRENLARVVQLVNKTNQFNLTTRRYSEAEVASLMDDPSVIALQIRLTDRFGDNGIIAVVIGRIVEKTDLLIECWLMSCRVLGRKVEQATMNLLAKLAAERGATRIVGEYRPTARNDLVRDHYAKLGFTLVDARECGTTVWSLPLDRFQPASSDIAVRQGTK